MTYHMTELLCCLCGTVIKLKRMTIFYYFLTSNVINVIKFNNKNKINKEKRKT